MNTTQTTAESIIAVQIVETATGRVTRTELTGNLTPTQTGNVVRNFESAARGDEEGRYEVHVVRAGENVRR